MINSSTETKKTTLITKKKKTSTLANKIRRGITVLELTLYLVIAAVILGIVLLSFQALQTNQREAATLQILNQTYAAVQDIYRSSTTYGTGISILPVLESANAIPTQARVAGDPVTMLSPFGDAITVVGNATSFEIGFAAYPQESCVDLVSTYATQQTGVDSITIVGATPPELVVPATVLAISDACDDATGLITFEFN